MTVDRLGRLTHWRRAFIRANGQRLAAGLRHPQTLTALANALIQVFTLVSAVLVARFLGPTGRGEVAVVVVWVALFQTLFSLNIPEAVTFLRARRSFGDRSLAGTGAASAGFMGISAVLAGLAALPYLMRGAPPRVIEEAQWYCLSVPLCYVTVTLYSELSGDQHFRLYNIFRTLHPVGYCIGIGLLASSRTLVPATVLLANAVAHLGVLSIWLAMNRPTWPQRRPWADISREGRTLFRTGLSFHGTTVVLVLLTRLDQYAVAHDFGLYDVGLYAVAATVASAHSLIANAFSQIVTPIIASRDRSVAVPLLVKQLKRAAVWSCAAAVGVATISPFLVPLLFGEAFRPAVRLVWLLTPAYLAAGLATLLGLGLRGLDHPHAATAAGGGAAAAFCVVWFLLRRHARLDHVAIALDLAQALMLAGLVLFLKRTYRLTFRQMCEA